uniref:hypothetical protein n=1 Tax=Methylobacterium sp. B34 TaxID=95563 RepID=UPI000FE14C39|nr:hypothetical protein [Methylobacterium sp. B34]
MTARQVIEATYDAATEIAFPRGRTVRDFLRIAMNQIAVDPQKELRLTARQVREIVETGIGIKDLEQLARAQIELQEKALREVEPITVEAMKSMAERVAYEEIYDVYRHRKEVEGDRLHDVTARAVTLNGACAKLIYLAGFDTMEAKELGLDQFDAGTVFELCDRLEELTGDTYSVSNFETQSEPEA